MMRVSAGAWWAPWLSFGLLACVGQVSEEDHPCPCAAGWACCGANVCVPSASSCPAAADAAARGGDGAPGSASDASTGTAPDDGPAAAPDATVPPRSADASAFSVYESGIPIEHNDAQSPFTIPTSVGPDAGPHFDAGPIPYDGGRFTCANWHLRMAGQPGINAQDPVFVATADLNRDGFLDIVLAGNNPGSQLGPNVLEILAGDGTGTFAPLVSIVALVDEQPIGGAAIGDIHGDGTVDIVADEPGLVWASLNTGYGGFFAPVASPADTQGGRIATGDFDGDGKLDVVYTSQNLSSSTGIVAVALGDGTGAFREPTVAYEVGVVPGGIAVADLDRDGRLDVVVTNAFPGVNVMFGNGDGTLRYGPAAGAVLQFSPADVAIQDINHDGILDLALAAQDANAIEVLLGRGDGTFQPPAFYNTDAAPYAIAVADFDGDGNPDVVTANYEASTVSVFLGHGDGSFRLELPFPAGSNPQSLAVGDVNGDGMPDLVVGDSLTNAVTVLLGACGP